VTDNTITPRPDAALILANELEEAAWSYVRASKAANTVRAYRADLADFTLWCKEHSRESLPAQPETICLYITALAGHSVKPSTIQRRLSSISQAHQLAGQDPSPTHDAFVRMTMSGIRRTLGTAPAQKAPVVTSELRRLLAVTPEDTKAGLRDRALLLVGFAGGFRRSELVGLNVEDLLDTDDGLRVQIRRSKTDQEAEGRELGLPHGQHPETCPVRAVRAWRKAAGINDGPLFRPINRHDQIRVARLTPEGVALVVKRAAERAGFDPTHYAGHSLRSGLATAAAAGGAPERAIMRQTGHRSVQTVRRYIRSGSLFTDNAAAYVGL
jgi:site-specific recombinase XerD